MGWQHDFIAVDWGTTNRRAYRLEGGEAVDSFTDDCGVLSIPQHGFGAAAAEIRERLGDLPMLLAGMVGSNRGWFEAPYVACPAGSAEIANGIVWIDPRTGIVPGVCQLGQRNADVMRGEEVQLIGAVAAGLVPQDALVCLPGTHAKWVLVQAGQVARFSTMMTGELFALVRAHSILASSLSDEPALGADFDAGVDESLGGESLLCALFRIRARSLVNANGECGASRASGILIGADVASALHVYRNFPAILIGRPDLCALYARALERAGCASREIDGGAAFLAGVSSLTQDLTRNPA